MFAQDKWKKDKEKIDYAKSKGYMVLIIWERDFKNNKEDVIKECLEFINNG